jgi:hypothetical protein
MKCKKIVIVISVIMTMIIITVFSLLLFPGEICRKQYNHHTGDTSAIIQPTSFQTITSLNEIDPVPAARPTTVCSTKEDTPLEPEPAPVLPSFSKRKPPEPDCIYLGANEAAWHCYRNRRRLILFHDWQCSNKKVTRVEIIRETDKTCFDDSGADLFEPVDE